MKPFYLSLILFFIVAIGFNSLGLLEENVVQTINFIDNFALTMAMCAGIVTGKQN